MEQVKEKLKKLNDWKFIILIILIVGGAFYWYEMRPSMIRSSCSQQARGSLFSISPPNKYDRDYKLCLRRHGFE